MTIKALRFALTVLKHGKHDQSSHGRRGSGGGGLAPATMGARPAKPSLQQIIDTARPYADLPIDYTPEQMKAMEQHLQNMQRHMERTEQIRSRHFNPDGTPKTPTSRKECFDELQKHAKDIIKDSTDMKLYVDTKYPSYDQVMEHISVEGDYKEHSERMSGNHVNVMNAITLEAWRQSTPGTVPDIFNNNPDMEQEYRAVYGEVFTLFDYVYTAPGDENAPQFNDRPIELISNPGDTQYGGYFAAVLPDENGVRDPSDTARMGVNYNVTDKKFIPVVNHETAHLIQAMKPHYIDADMQFLRDRGGNYLEEKLLPVGFETYADYGAKTHYPYASTVYYRGPKVQQNQWGTLYRVRPDATEIATTTAENVFGYARGSWMTVRDISTSLSKIPDEAALTYALFNS